MEGGIINIEIKSCLVILLFVYWIITGRTDPTILASEV